MDLATLAILILQSPFSVRKIGCLAECFSSFFYICNYIFSLGGGIPVKLREEVRWEAPLVLVVQRRDSVDIHNRIYNISLSLPFSLIALP